MIRIAIVIEEAGGNFAAAAPDLAGCIATGTTIEEVTNTLRDAIREHLEFLRETGEEIAPARSRADVIEVPTSLTSAPSDRAPRLGRTQKSSGPTPTRRSDPRPQRLSAARWRASNSPTRPPH